MMSRGGERRKLLTDAPKTWKQYDQLMRRATVSKTRKGKGKVMPNQAVNELRQRIKELEAENAGLRKRDEEMARALSFAQSVIKSGEPWTAACEEIIGGALGRRSAE
jgi:hypothetical protein